MTSENPFRIAVVVVMVLTVAVTAYHRLQAAASGEKISRKDEGYLFAAVLRLSGLCLFIATLAYVISPSSVQWASFPLPIVVSLAGYCHWDSVLIPDVLDSEQPWQESDGHRGHTSRSDSGYARPVSLGATSVLCDNSIAHGVRDSAGSELADRCRQCACLGTAGCSHAERRTNADREIWSAVQRLHGKDRKIHSSTLIHETCVQQICPNRR